MKLIVTRTDNTITCSYRDKIDYSTEAGDMLTTLLDDVVHATGVTYNELFTHTRRRRIALARHLFCFVARRHLSGFSLPEIAAVFGINHATVVHACHNIENMLQLNDYVSLMVQLQYLEVLGVRNEELGVTKVTDQCNAPDDYICNVNDDGVCGLPTSCCYQNEAAPCLTPYALHLTPITQ